MTNRLSGAESNIPKQKLFVPVIYHCRSRRGIAAEYTYAVCDVCIDLHRFCKRISALITGCSRRSGIHVGIVGNFLQVNVVGASHFFPELRIVAFVVFLTYPD